MRKCWLISGVAAALPLLALAETTSTRLQVDSNYIAPTVSAGTIGSPANSSEEKATVVATSGQTVTRTFSNYDVCLVSGVRGRVKTSNTNGVNTPYPDCNVVRDAATPMTWVATAKSGRVGTTSLYTEAYCDIACYKQLEPSVAATSTGSYEALTPPVTVTCAAKTVTHSSVTSCTWDLPNGNPGDTFYYSKTVGPLSCRRECTANYTCSSTGDWTGSLTVGLCEGDRIN
jgi:hypothetical protein